MSTYVLKQDNAAPRLYNGSGAAWAQGDFVIVGALCGRVAEPDGVAAGAYGAVEMEPRMTIRSTDLTEGEDTFATPNQTVFEDGSGNFSDTETVGYYAVGQLVRPKGDNDEIEFIKYHLAEEVVS